ncbi:MAG: POTRA domain-containing protein [Terracidiphilus sp.]
MRIVICSLFLWVFASFGLAQDSPQAPEPAVQVRALTIVASDLPEADRQRIEDSLQGETYSLEELSERVRQNLRDLGYYSAHAESPQLASISEAPLPRSADVSIQVKPGAQYRLGQIAFQGATVFPPDQLRRQFPIEAGSLFNATRVGKGLEALRDLYLEKGYVNFGAMPLPRIDEVRRVIDLTIDVDEGNRYDFGRLILDGVEPRVGTAKALLAAWTSLQGKPYNPQLLAKWLAANAPFLNHPANMPDQVTAHQDQAAGQIDIQLELP